MSETQSAWNDGYRVGVKAGAEAAARQVTELRAAAQAYRDRPTAEHGRALDVLLAGDKAEAPPKRVGHIIDGFAASDRRAEASTKWSAVKRELTPAQRSRVDAIKRKMRGEAPAPEVGDNAEAPLAMSDIRVDAAGVPWSKCPLCDQDVVPSANGWRRHQPFCPAKDGLSVPFPPIKAPRHE